MKSLSHVRLFSTPWTVAHQAPLSMGFSRQEYWSGLPFPSPGNLPDPGIDRVCHYFLVLCVCVCVCVQLLELCPTLWTIACQALLSMGFSRQEYWSGLPCSSPGDLLNPGFEPVSSASQVDSLLLSHLKRY